MQRMRILRQHVRTDQLLGVEAVPVGQVPADVTSDAAAPPPSRRPSQRRSRPEPDPSTGAGLDAFIAGPVATLVDDPQPAAKSGRTRGEKQQALAKLDREQVSGCTRCELCRSRMQTVFGEGDADAGLMFIGEGPGQNEDEQGRPFVGRAGELLTKMIAAMGFAREQVFIANVVKCRPPGNRTPTPAEADACWPYLRRQILTIEPHVIVTLGGPATKRLLDTKTGITALRGTWHLFHGIEPEGPAVPVMPTFHPAYLLRSYTKENRAKVWSDLQAAMRLLDR